MKTSLGKLHHQATDWLRELDFYYEEINLLLKRLEDSLSKNESVELKKQFDDFRNEFKSLLKSINTMKHDVSVREGVIENMTEETLGDSNDEVETQEDVILKQMKELSHEIADARFLFNFFLSKLP